MIDKPAHAQGTEYVLPSTVGSHQHGTPASQKHSPWVSRDRELSFSYFESFCPALDPFFIEGLRRARYDSPSMTRS
jgi:hypothetical protein